MTSIFLHADSQVPPILSFSMEEGDTNANTNPPSINLPFDKWDPQNLQYTIPSEDQDASLFKITAGVIKLKDEKTLDYEENEKHSFRVEVCDRPPYAYDCEKIDIEIKVEQVNEKPIFDKEITIDNPIPENKSAEELIASVSAKDPDNKHESVNQVLSYEIISNSPNNKDGLFHINEFGKVTLKDGKSLDFETKQLHEITVQVSDNQSPPLTDEIEIEIKVKDVNEAPIFNDDAISELISEDILPRIMINAMDPDNKTNNHQSITYSIIKNSPNNDNGLFYIKDKSSGEISLNSEQKLNYEEQQLHTIIVQVSDNQSPPLTDEIEIEIRVKDENEKPIIPPSQPTVFSIYEHFPVIPNNNIIGKISAVDPDKDVLIYMKKVSNSNEDSNMFQIIENTGEITLVNGKELDYETAQTHTIPVLVTEKNTNPPLSTEVTITINVLNINESPTITPNQIFTTYETINENTSQTPPISRLDANNNPTSENEIESIDPDFNDENNFAIISNSISQNGSPLFNIDPTEGIITLSNGQYLDFEYRQEHIISVQVKDREGLNSTENITIKVEDVNERAIIETATYLIAENASVGTEIGKVNAVDPENKPLNYDIISTSPRSGANLFSIDKSTGIITLASTEELNYENGIHSYVIEVQVRDHELSSEKPITINVTDVNEYPTITEGQKFPAMENIPPGSIINRIEVKDVDTNDSHKFTIITNSISPSGNNLFTIDSNTGELRLSARQNLDFESKQLHKIIVQAEDSGRLVSNKLVQIQVTNVNESPKIEDQIFMVSENIHKEKIIGTVIAEDPEEQPLEYNISSDSESKLFNIDKKFGVITLKDKESLDYESEQTHSITVQIRDNENTSEATITINVLDLTDEPPIIKTQTLRPKYTDIDKNYIGTIDIEDRDAGDVHNFAITNNSRSDSGVGLFAIDRDTGAVSINSGQVLDKTKDQYKITVWVKDSADNDTTEEITIILPQRVGTERYFIY